MKFQGSFPALITPYWKNYTINFSELYQLLEMHSRYSDGVVLLGSTGEGWLLSENEQKQIVDQAAQRFDGTMIVNMNCWSAAHFAQKLQLFEESLHKMSAFLLPAPPYLKLSSDQVIAFYQECAELSPVPLIAYHIPARNGISFTDTVYDFLSKQHNIIGVKETVLSQLQNYATQYRLTLFAGEDSFLSEPFVDTSINVGGNLFPDIFSACPEQMNWAQWQNILQIANNPLVIKEMMFQQQLISFAGCRPPLGELSVPLKLRIEAEFKDVLSHQQTDKSRLSI